MKGITFALCLIIGLTCYTNEVQCDRPGFFVRVIAENIENLKLSTDKLIRGAMNTTKNLLDGVQKNADKWVHQAQESANNTQMNINNWMNKTLEDIQENIKKVREEAKKNDVDLSECEVILHKLGQSIVSQVSGISGCLTESITKVTNGLEPLKDETNKVLNTLSGLLGEAQECLADPNTKIPTNLACLADVNVKAVLNVTPKVFPVTVQLGKFAATALMAPLPATFCMATKSFSNLIAETSSTIGSVTSCIQGRVKSLVDLLPKQPQGTDNTQKITTSTPKITTGALNTPKVEDIIQQIKAVTPKITEVNAPKIIVNEQQYSIDHPPIDVRSNS